MSESFWGAGGGFYYSPCFPSKLSSWLLAVASYLFLYLIKQMHFVQSIQSYVYVQYKQITATKQDKNSNTLTYTFLHIHYLHEQPYI